MRIKFLGTNGRYLASTTGNSAANVERVGPRAWAGSFYGNPMKRNPVETDPVTGATSRSCTCPRVQVEGTFSTRLAAADAALKMQAEDYR